MTEKKKIALIEKTGNLARPLMQKPGTWSGLTLKIIIGILIVIGYLYKIQLEKKYENDIQNLEERLRASESTYLKTLDSVQKSSSELVNTLTNQLKEIEEHNEQLNRHNRILLEQNQKLGKALQDRNIKVDSGRQANLTSTEN